MISNFTKDSITCMLTTFALPNSSDRFRPQAILTCLALFYGVRDGCHGAVADMFIGWRDAQLEDWRWPVWSSHDCKSSQTAAWPSWFYQELIGKLRRKLHYQTHRTSRTFTMNVGVSGVGLGFTILDEVEIQPLKDSKFAAWIILPPQIWIFTNRNNTLIQCCLRYRYIQRAYIIYSTAPPKKSILKCNITEWYNFICFCPFWRLVYNHNVSYHKTYYVINCNYIINIYIYMIT